ncbi:MAG: NUDIX hydrolase [Niabella sp.]
MEQTNPWKITDSKQIYDNPWIGVTEYDVINPSGRKGIYGKVHFKNVAIGVMVLDEDNHTYLVGQYRFVTDSYSWEMPEGGCPLGSGFLESAKRELLEETGLVANNWKELFRMHLSNSVTDELAVVYVARELTQEIACPEETEQLVVKKIPFDELVKLVEEGAITDSMTVAATMKVQLLKQSGNL